MSSSDVPPTHAVDTVQELKKIRERQKIAKQISRESKAQAERQTDPEKKELYMAISKTQSTIDRMWEQIRMLYIVESQNQEYLLMLSHVLRRYLREHELGLLSQIDKRSNEINEGINYLLDDDFEKTE